MCNNFRSVFQPSKWAWTRMMCWRHAEGLWVWTDLRSSVREKPQVAATDHEDTWLHLADGLWELCDSREWRSTPRVHSNSGSSSGWCHPTISSSVVPFSSHLQSFLASGSFPMSQFFVSGGQSIGVSASASVLPMNIKDWFYLRLTSWMSLQSRGLSRVFSNTTVQKHQFVLINLNKTLSYSQPLLVRGGGCGRWFSK